MTDPFDALAEPVTPVAPDPLFAAHLRARLARALTLPKGVTVSDAILTVGPIETPTPGAPPVSRPPTVVPYLIVADGRRAIEWYQAALGARPVGDALVMPDGRVGHAELAVAGSPVYLADQPAAGEPPFSEVAAPRPDQPATVSLTLVVPDVDGVVATATAAGARLERPAADYPYGRNAVVRDPFGHRWIVTGPVLVGGRPAYTSPRSTGVTPSDVVYASLWVPDGERASRFFADVLGWTYRPHSGSGSRQVEGLSMPHGILGGQPRSTLFLCLAVEDLDGAIGRVRAAGGVAGEPVDQPWGTVADCTDNQGTAFALVKVGPGSARPGGRPPANGERHGDVAYLTMEVEDSARARAFYAGVAGWRFRPGRVDDGWGVDDVVPMTGLRGGVARATTVPMYRVDDVAAAVERVRAAGGSATDPVEEPYGWQSECSDDQGTRFSLGQL